MSITVSFLNEFTTLVPKRLLFNRNPFLILVNHSRMDKQRIRKSDHRFLHTHHFLSSIKPHRTHFAFSNMTYSNKITTQFLPKLTNRTLVPEFVELALCSATCAGLGRKDQTASRSPGLRALRDVSAEWLVLWLRSRLTAATWIQRTFCSNKNPLPVLYMRNKSLKTMWVVRILINSVWNCTAVFFLSTKWYQKFVRWFVSWPVTFKIWSLSR